MDPSIARTVIAPIVLASIALVTTAHAAAPPASCQVVAPHHTITLGPSVDARASTSTLAYWDNECKCYVVELEVPADSSPASHHLQKRFDIDTTSADQFPRSESETSCKSIHEREYLYKKQDSGALVLVASSETNGSWVFGVPPFTPPNTSPAHYCALKQATSGAFTYLTPPAHGTATYRILRSAEKNGAFQPVTMIARHSRLPDDG